MAAAAFEHCRVVAGTSAAVHMVALAVHMAVVVHRAAVEAAHTSAAVHRAAVGVVRTSAVVHRAVVAVAVHTEVVDTATLVVVVCATAHLMAATVDTTVDLDTVPVIVESWADFA